MSFKTSGGGADHLAFRAGPQNASISTARTGVYHDVSGARGFTGVVSIPAVTQGATVTVRLRKAVNASGGSAALLAERIVVIEADSPPASVSYALAVSASDADLGDGFTHVAVEVLCSAAVAGSGALILDGLRFTPE